MRWYKWPWADLKNKLKDGDKETDKGLCWACNSIEAMKNGNVCLFVLRLLSWTCCSYSRNCLCIEILVTLTTKALITIRTLVCHMSGIHLLRFGHHHHQGVTRCSCSPFMTLVRETRCDALAPSSDRSWNCFDLELISFLCVSSRYKYTCTFSHRK